MFLRETAKLRTQHGYIVPLTCCLWINGAVSSVGAGRVSAVKRENYDRQMEIRVVVLI
jgi:hypothetical protein